MLTNIPDFASLHNGIQVITCTDPSVLYTTIGVYSSLGAVSDPIGLPGTFHATEHMIFRGSKSYPNKIAVARELEKYNGRINGATSALHTEFHITIPTRRFALAAEILASIFFEPTLAQEHWEIERGAIFEEIKQNQDDINRYFPRRLKALLFAGTEMANLGTGTLESVEKISIVDIRSAHQRLINTNHLTVIVTGGSPENLELILESSFGKYAMSSTRETVREAPTPNMNKPNWRELRQGNQQSRLGLCWMYRNNSITENEGVALKVFTTMMDAGMSTPLFQNLREKTGLTYQQSFNFGLYCKGLYTLGFSSRFNPSNSQAVRDAFWESVDETLWNTELLDFAQTRLVEKLELEKPTSQLFYEQTLALLEGVPWQTNQRQIELSLEVTPEMIFRTIDSLVKNHGHATFELFGQH